MNQEDKDKKAREVAKALMEGVSSVQGLSDQAAHHANMMKEIPSIEAKQPVVKEAKEIKSMTEYAQENAERVKSQIEAANELREKQKEQKLQEYDRKQKEFQQQLEKKKKEKDGFER